MKKFRPATYLAITLISCHPAVSQVNADAQPMATARSEIQPKLEEVLVTASKRTESLQDVMGSVTAVSSETLERNNVEDFETLADITPGMQLRAQDVGGDALTIRGIGRTVSGGLSPVAFHINDVFTALRGEPYYDLSAVELIRGPSGTTYGRNATAGAINVKWAPPEDYLGGGWDVRYSDLSEQRVRGYINLPLLGEGDRRLLARVAGYKRDSDGTLDNLLVPDDSDPGNSHDWFVRLFIASELNDSLRFGLRAVRYENDLQGSPNVFSPDLATRQRGDLEDFGAQPLTNDLNEVRSRTDQIFGVQGKNNFTRIDGDVTWSVYDVPILGDMDLVLVGGEIRREFTSVFDFDGTEQPILDGMHDASQDFRRSAEFRVVTYGDGIDLQAGFFYYRQTTEELLDAFVGLYVDESLAGLEAGTLQGVFDSSGLAQIGVERPTIPATARLTQSDLQRTDDSRAAFINVKFDLAQLLGGPNVDLTFGIRQNKDEFTSITGRQLLKITDPVEVVLADDRDIHQFQESNETTGEIGAQWFYSDMGMLYLKFARGYKPGLAQAATGSSGETVQIPVDPEYIYAWEAGWKTTLLDETLKINSAAYYYDYTNLQVTQIRASGVVTENASEATITGVEIESEWVPLRSLNIKMGMSYTNARYDDFCSQDPSRYSPDEPEPGCNSEAPYDFSGEQLANAPDFTAYSLIRYTFDLGSYGLLTPMLKSNWTDTTNAGIFGSDAAEMKSYFNTDVRVAWTSVDNQWRIELFAENIEDHDDVFGTHVQPLPFLGGQGRGNRAFGSPIAPRVVGMSIGMKWL